MCHPLRRRPKVLELAHTAPCFHAALGIHPESLIEEDAATVAVYHGDWRAELDRHASAV